MYPTVSSRDRLHARGSTPGIIDWIRGILFLITLGSVTYSLWWGIVQLAQAAFKAYVGQF